MLSGPGQYWPLIFGHLATDIGTCPVQITQNITTSPEQETVNDRYDRPKQIFQILCLLLDGISVVDIDNLILQDMGSLKIFQIGILNFLLGLGRAKKC